MIQGSVVEAYALDRFMEEGREAVKVTFLNKANLEVTIPAHILLVNTQSHGHAQPPERLGNIVSTWAAEREELEVSALLLNLDFVGIKK